MTPEQIQWWAAAKYLAYKKPDKYKIIREYNIYKRQVETKLKEFYYCYHYSECRWETLGTLPDANN